MKVKLPGWCQRGCGGRPSGHDEEEKMRNTAGACRCREEQSARHQRAAMPPKIGEEDGQAAAVWGKGWPRKATMEMDREHEAAPQEEEPAIDEGADGQGFEVAEIVARQASLVEMGGVAGIAKSCACERLGGCENGGGWGLMTPA